MKLFLPFLVSIVSALLIQGCTTAAVISTAIIGTKISIDPRTVGTQVDDSTLELRVNNALSQNKQIKEKARVRAVVYQGKVLLVGQVPNPDFLFYMKRVLMSIEGIDGVFNEVRQCHPIGLNTILSDTWITIKVQSQLLTSNLVKFTNVKVTTENKEVFLLGLVTKHEGEAVTNIVSRINGVKQVKVAFTYIN